MAIPKAMQAIYNKIAPLITEFCQHKLDDEHCAVCLRMLEKLCRKRPSPLLNGRPNTWAAGIVYEIASINFVFDKSNPFHMSAADIADGFGVAASTAYGKAAQIRKLLNSSRLDPEWTTATGAVDNPLLWMISVNGFIVDVRHMPLHIQQQALDKGLIPSLPGHEKLPSETE